MSQSTGARNDKRPEYVTLIAIYQFVTAGILFLLSCLIPAVLFPAIVFYVDASEGVFGGLAIATAGLALFIGFGFASVVVGWGLLRMREWARLGAIVLGAFALIGFPIWTIAAILVLVYLTSADAKNAFVSFEQPRTGDPRHHDALAARAVYKADPPPDPEASPLEQTRPLSPVSPDTETAGGRATTTPPSDESHRIDHIPMPGPDEPGEDETQKSGDPPPRKWTRPPEEAAMDDRIIRPRDGEQDQT